MNKKDDKSKKPAMPQKGGATATATAPAKQDSKSQPAKKK